MVLITIDTVRADHVGCYGATDVKTPTLDALARDGIVFERAISQVPLTWPSHAAILTGTYPFQNGVQDFTGQPLDDRFHSVAQVFKQQGYATGAVVSAFVLDPGGGGQLGAGARFRFLRRRIFCRDFSRERHWTGGSQGRRKRDACDFVVTKDSASSFFLLVAFVTKGSAQSVRSARALSHSTQDASL